jgi:hypothetical protein
MMLTFEQRLQQIQTILDAALVKAQESYLLDLTLQNEKVSSSHQLLLLAMFDCAEGKAIIETVKGAFKNYLESVKVNQAFVMVKAKHDENYSEGRLCFSIGCLGFVTYVAGKGKCQTCGLFQVILEDEYLWTSTNYSESEMMIPVVSLAERRKRKQLEDTKNKSENVMSLF